MATAQGNTSDLGLPGHSNAESTFQGEEVSAPALKQMLDVWWVELYSILECLSSHRACSNANERRHGPSHWEEELANALRELERVEEDTATLLRAMRNAKRTEVRIATSYRVVVLLTGCRRRSTNTCPISTARWKKSPPRCKGP